ncbi:MAG: hypothetical protein ACKVP7_18390 [Hyphomicrobiaceae bacterium]
MRATARSLAAAWRIGAVMSVAAGWAVCLALVASPPAAAAVRHCADRIEMFADHAASETEARRLAMERWTAAARAIGDSFTRWQLANNRSLHCVRIPGGFRCRAGGAPCSISNNPGRVPEALQPKASPPLAPFPPAKNRLDI